MPDDATPRSARGVYSISVTAELAGLDPQTLRLYERRGLLTPGRTQGGTRRYSDDDIARLGRISDLTAAGINIAGIAAILALQDRNTYLENDNARLTSTQAQAQPQAQAQAERATIDRTNRKPKS